MSPQAMSKSYTPVYKYTIPKSPEPSDDEDSDGWNDDDDDKNGKYVPSPPLRLMLNA